ncbi:MAG: AFG1 family ATPase [Rhizobiales bacterium]|nr:AFG1 family ATPase [Hyphomicrobiales bacterium]
MPESVRRCYEAKVAAGELKPDACQRALADALDRLGSDLADRARKSKTSALGWLLAKGSTPEAPRGLYIWGGVGTGKTFLMDLFFRAAPIRRKRRVHFHAFMAEVHDRIAGFREKLKSGEARGDDPIPPVAAAIAAEAELLCFDEFTVTDIGDAMILGRLFEQLFQRGMTVVATSNVAPDDLYKDGLNRALFIPFVTLLQERMAAFHLDGERDYRQDDAAFAPLYFSPLGPRSEACLDAHFRRLTGSKHGTPRLLKNRSRSLPAPEAAGGVARFSFADLCARPLGAGDYLKIAGVFQTIILADVPVLGPATRNEAKRFINLIDTLYDNRIRLIVSAAAEPADLWRGDDGTEAFEFARTASRLTEMRSDAYWDAASPPEADEKSGPSGLARAAG